MATGQLEINSLAEIVENWETLTDSSVIIEYVYNNYSVYINNVLDDTIVLNVNLFNTLKDLGFLNRLENTISNNAIVQFTIKPELQTAPVIKMLEKLLLLTYEKSYNTEQDINNAVISINYTCYWDREFDYQGTVGLMSYSKCIEIRDSYNNSVFVPYGQNRDYLAEGLLYYNRFYNKLLTYYMYLRNITEFDINSLTALVTINTVPSNATVLMEVSGANYYTNSMYVTKGDTVNYTVTANGWGTESGTVIVEEDITINVTLTQLTATLTINTVPGDATITFSGDYISAINNSVTTYIGNVVTYTVSADGYTSVTEEYTVTEEETINVSLDLVQYTLTINTSPSNAGAIVSFSGDYISTTSNSVTAYIGSIINYTVSASGYTTVTQNNYTITKNETVTVQLSKNTVTLTINTTPSSATVIFRDSNYISQSGKSVTVYAGTTVNYTVTANGYTSKNGSKTVNSTQTINVSLSQNEYFVLDSDLMKVGNVNVPANGSDNGLASGFSYTSSSQSASNVKGNYFSFNPSNLSQTNWEMQIKFKATDVTTTQGLSGRLDWDSVSQTTSAYGCRFEIASGKLKILIGRGNINSGGMDISNGGISIAVNTYYTVKVSYNGTAYKINCNGTETTYTSSNKIVWGSILPLGGRLYRPLNTFWYKLVPATYCTIDLMNTWIKSNGSYVVWNTNILPSS